MMALHRGEDFVAALDEVVVAEYGRYLGLGLGDHRRHGTGEDGAAAGRKAQRPGTVRVGEVVDVGPFVRRGLEQRHGLEVLTDRRLASGTGLAGGDDVEAGA